MSKSNEPATAALADIYHHGLLVADLAATMAALGPALGVEWAPVRSFSPMPMWLADGTEAVAHLKVAYSRQGPIHLELIEARPGDAYGALRAENQAHLGVWVEDLAGEAEALLAAGWRMVLSGAPAASGYGLIAYLAPPDGGPVVELVSAALRGAMAEWWAS